MLGSVGRWLGLDRLFGRGKVDAKGALLTLASAALEDARQTNPRLRGAALESAAIRLVMERYEGARRAEAAIAVRDARTAKKGAP